MPSSNKLVGFKNNLFESVHSKWFIGPFSVTSKQVALKHTVVFSDLETLKKHFFLFSEAIGQISDYPFNH